MREMGEANGPELKNRVGVSALSSFSSFSQSWGARELMGAPGCFTGVRESSHGRTERLSIPPRGLDGRVRVRSWMDETGYLRGRRMGERGGKRDGLRIERNSSSASEGKLDLGDARGDAFGDFESGSKWTRGSSSSGASTENNLSAESAGVEAIRRGWCWRWGEGRWIEKLVNRTGRGATRVILSVFDGMRMSVMADVKGS
jgi:hypothetical protein